MSDTAHTPGPWKWWTSNSWRRLKRDDRGITMNVLEPYVCRDGCPDLTITEADMNLIAAAPDYDAAAGPAITVLAFAQERAFNERDELAYRQITTAKNALIAAMEKARGKEPAMRDVTPSGPAIAKAEGHTP